MGWGSADTDLLACINARDDDPDVISFHTIKINMFDNLSKGFYGMCMWGCKKVFDVHEVPLYLGSQHIIHQDVPHTVRYDWYLD